MSSSIEPELPYSIDCRDETWAALVEYPNAFQYCVDLAQVQEGKGLVQLATLLPVVQRIIEDLGGAESHSMQKLVRELEDSGHPGTFRDLHEITESMKQVYQDILAFGYKPKPSKEDTAAWKTSFVALEEALEAWGKSIESLEQAAKSAAQPTFAELSRKLLSDVHLALHEIGLLRPQNIILGVNCKIRRSRSRSRDRDFPEYDVSILTFDRTLGKEGKEERKTFALTSKLEAAEGDNESLSEILTAGTCLLPVSLLRSVPSRRDIEVNQEGALSKKMRLLLSKEKEPEKGIPSFIESVLETLKGLHFSFNDSQLPCFSGQPSLESQQNLTAGSSRGGITSLNGAASSGNDEQQTPESSFRNSLGGFK